MKRGKKVTFEDSDESETENQKELELGGSSDEDDIDLTSKIDRLEFEGEKDRSKNFLSGHLWVSVFGFFRKRRIMIHDLHVDIMKS